MNPLSRIGSVVLLGVLAVVGCSSRPTGPMTIPLNFRPTDQLDIGAAKGVMSKSVSIQVEDQRDRKDQVGQNSEKETVVPVLTTSQPTDFVKEALARNLSATGVRVMPSGADRTIHIALTRLWVEEGNTYNGNVAANVTVTPASGGQPLWSGQVTGTNERFGRSLSPENYQECLSDSVMQMCNHLLADDGFRAALK
jgi:uncharacterized lipoprotein YajG